MSAGTTLRLPVIGVMGSGDDAHAELAAPLGRWLAELGVHLVTGGGGGVMQSVSRAFCEVRPRSGLSIGILPAAATGSGSPPRGYPNDWVELPIKTHLLARGEQGASPDSRNHLNVLTADLVIALPGGPGTRSEVALAIVYRRPIVVWKNASDAGPPLPGDVCSAASLEEVQAFVRKELAYLRDGRSGR